jgi:glycerate kinase
MRVLIAFDKFKDSVAAADACAIAARAIASARPGWGVDPCPLSDGGEGFAEILTRAAGGKLTRLPATGPRGGKVEAAFGIVSIDGIPPGARALMRPAASGPVAVVEMASASGLALLEPGLRDPMRASSLGTGEILRAAAGAGAGTILLGVGGSATHDLGLGAVGALGVRFSGAAGEALDPLVPADWPLLRAIGGRIPEGFPPILIACDVDNPLVGPRGALAVYGRQKGLRPGDEAALEAGTARVAELVCGQFGRPRDLVNLPGAGAAGGIAFGLMAVAGARLLPGFPLVSAWLDLDRRMDEADMVITGEGRFDDSSLSGKGPGSVARRALALGKRVHVFAGEVSLSSGVPGLITHAVTPPGMGLAEALARAPDLLSDSIRLAVSEA